ncbi:hypothetical protein CKAH01_06854 [Colletotrichum kahawae]|uniref:Uncharacterized protein n=1 Tax=Colletotrichum kahawae TaxID=34407 RepID=A0AAD9Y841_COLKA|nr:hypothetical protein CKAH01_06854 [Colletotrichum kahawae]
MPPPSTSSGVNLPPFDPSASDLPGSYPGMNMPPIGLDGQVRNVGYPAPSNLEPPTLKICGTRVLGLLGSPKTAPQHITEKKGGQPSKSRPVDLRPAGESSRVMGPAIPPLFSLVHSRFLLTPLGMPFSLSGW